MLLVTYLIMGAVAGLVCLGDYWQKENTAGKKAIQILVPDLVLGNAFSYTWLILGSQEYHAYVIQNVRGINREGLRAGILTDYMTAYRYNNNLAVWPGRAGQQYRALCGTVPVLLYARRT